MSDELQRELAALTRLAVDVQRRRSVEDLLQLIVERTCEILRAPHVSLRLLDPSRTRLVAACRSGRTADAPPVDFALGEGLTGWVAQHGAPLLTNDPERDPRYVPRAGFDRVSAYAGVPLLAGARCVGVLAAVQQGDDARGFDDLDRSRLELIAAICAPHLEIARLSRLTRVDPLTGALNRRGLDRSFPNTAETLTGSVCVAVADIDHFKDINDEHGHAVGDEVLKHVTRRIGSVLRASDALVRFGGEEFVLLLPAIGVEPARQVAERARAAVAETPIVLGQARIPVTISVGVAERREGESRDALLSRADAAMYAAKQAGRDRVVVAD
jgi:diguanylate cyclase (GGDEF)-like protein